MIRFAWFGTSIMEHLEGYNAQLVDQANLPDIGSKVSVEDWRHQGYVRRLEIALQVAWPQVDFRFDNYAEGGSTSRHVRHSVRTVTNSGEHYDVAVVGCGINDVWRRFQGRTEEAVDLAEFTSNYQEILTLLTTRFSRVIAIEETPWGWDPTIDISLLNSELDRYNQQAKQLAHAANVDFIAVSEAFSSVAEKLFRNKENSSAPNVILWSDGIHLSEYGDELLFSIIEKHIRRVNLIAELIHRH